MTARIRRSLTATVSRGRALRRVEIHFFRSYPALRALPMARDCGSVVLRAHDFISVAGWMV